MPFDARKTNFTVFSLNQELFNLIKSAINMKLESKSTGTYTMSVKTAAESLYITF